MIQTSRSSAVRSCSRGTQLPMCAQLPRHRSRLARRLVWCCKESEEWEYIVDLFDALRRERSTLGAARTAVDVNSRQSLNLPRRGLRPSGLVLSNDRGDHTVLQRYDPQGRDV